MRTQGIQVRKVTSLAVVAVLVAGCQTTGDTRDDDYRETQLGGAAIGAGIGALIGAATGDRRSAALGALIGGAIGAGVGTAVANRKQQYATTAELIDGETAEVETQIAAANEQNRYLETRIAELDRETQVLDARARRGENVRVAVARTKQEIDVEVAEADRVLAGVEKEIEVSGAMLADARKTGASEADVAIWDERRAELIEQRDELERKKKTFVAMGGRI